MADKKETVVYTPEQFAKAYQELCDKMEHRVMVTPSYVSRDDGSWSTILRFSVGKLPRVDKKKNI